MLSSHPLRGSNINWTNVLSCLLVPLFADNQWHHDTVYSHLLLVHLNSNWGPFQGWPRRPGPDPLYQTARSCDGTTTEEQGTIKQSLLLLPGACCHQDPVWCGPFAWFGSYRVSSGGGGGRHGPRPTLQHKNPDKSSHTSPPSSSPMKPHRNQKLPVPHPTEHKSW